MTGVEVFTLIKDFALTGAAISGAVVAIKGLGTWRRQLKGQSEYELSRRILVSLFKYRDAINGVRHPAVFSYELPHPSEDEAKSMSPEDIHYYGISKAYQNRWEKVQDQRTALYADQLEAEAIWGDELNTLFKTIYSLEHELFTRVRHYLVLPFSWQMFYLSALSFVIGNIIFIAFAPKISKEFLDYGDFKAKGKLAKDIGMYASREHANRTEQINNIMKSCRDYGLLKFEPSQNPNDAYHASESEKQKFWDLFNERVTSRLWGRIICTLCYFSGMVFFVIVALQNVYWTINEIFSFA